MATADVTRGVGSGRPDGAVRRARRLTTETKAAFKTTEFWAMIGLIVAILVSAAVIKGGDDGTDQFIARQAWLYVAILGGGTSSRAGSPSPVSREPYTDDPTERTDGR